MVNLRNNIQRLLDCKYPIYRINGEDIEEVDGLVLLGGKLIDDTNMRGETLGERRLVTPHKKLYKLNGMRPDIQSVLHKKSGFYIDSLGFILYYEKNVWCKLVYHEIKKISVRDTLTVLGLDGIRTPLVVQRPPPKGYEWAGVLYLDDDPWLLFDYAEYKLDNTRRKI